MARFTIRVELHNADEEDYETLHAAMEQEGFSRFITSDDGITYLLPTAEYDRDTTLNREQVIESAKRAARSTGRNFEVIVTEAIARIWHGLPRARTR
jgi:hypothetical protein